MEYKLYFYIILVYSINLSYFIDIEMQIEKISGFQRYALKCQHTEFTTDECSI